MRSYEPSSNIRIVLEFFAADRQRRTTSSRGVLNGVKLARDILQHCRKSLSRASAKVRTVYPWQSRILHRWLCPVPWFSDPHVIVAEVDRLGCFGPNNHKFLCVLQFTWDSLLSGSLSLTAEKMPCRDLRRPQAADGPLLQGVKRAKPNKRC